MQIDYKGAFPAPAPNAPFLGCRGGMSVDLVGEEKIICFGGRIGYTNNPTEMENEFSVEGVNYMYDFENVIMREGIRRTSTSSISPMRPGLSRSAALTRSRTSCSRATLLPTTRSATAS
ncbi:MAG: hypothetical protein P4M11_13375 [Candidatus Pacebacteria bacterium]|nr:hypothetical protein [Candidatus Paceibacterota bacterium]